MTKTFILTSEFEKKWELLGLSDDELRKLELEIIKNPHVGTVIPGTGKLRKMRFAIQNQGKSGSIRVCYVDFVIQETVYLITAYAKTKKDNLSKFECNNLKKMIEILESSFEK